MDDNFISTLQNQSAHSQADWTSSTDSTTWNCFHRKYLPLSTFPVCRPKQKLSGKKFSTNEEVFAESQPIWGLRRNCIMKMV